MTTGVNEWDGWMGGLGSDVLLGNVAKKRVATKTGHKTKTHCPIRDAVLCQAWLSLLTSYYLERLISLSDSCNICGIGLLAKCSGEVNWRMLQLSWTLWNVDWHLVESLGEKLHGFWTSSPDTSLWMDLKLNAMWGPCVCVCMCVCERQREKETERSSAWIQTIPGVWDLKDVKGDAVC